MSPKACTTLTALLLLAFIGYAWLALCCAFAHRWAFASVLAVIAAVTVWAIFQLADLERRRTLGWPYACRMCGSKFRSLKGKIVAGSCPRGRPTCPLEPR